MIVLDHIDPAMLVSANRRIHHMQRAKVCRYWRERIGDVIPFTDTETVERAHVTIHVRYPDNRRRDVGNLYPYVAKPLVDGLVDCGWLWADDDAHLIGPDLRREYPNGPHRIRIDIEEAT